MKLDEYLEKNCVLTGSRGMNLHNTGSDYDFAITSSQLYELQQLNLINMAYMTNQNDSGSYNKLMNDCSFKFYYDNREYNLIVYPTEECLRVIENITKAVSCIPEAEDKEIRNNIFEHLCNLLITNKTKGLPIVNINEDEIPF